jgi:hypothetical protein
MIDIMLEMGVVDGPTLEVAKKAKIQKLKKWSNIQNLENI